MPAPTGYDCFAITPPGLERLTAAELEALGLVPREMEPGGVGFRAGRDGIYSANLWLRTANRVVVRVGRFPATAFHELERQGRRLPWSRFVAPGSPVRFRVTCRKSKLYHSDAVAQRLLDAAFRSVGAVAAVPASAVTDATATGPTNPPEDDAEASAGAGLLFVVRVVRDVVTVSVDSSGALLHRRGYRQALARAPLRETLAAGLLLAAGYDGEAPLLDPMCGSGTIPIEGALIARRIAPGLAGAAAEGATGGTGTGAAARDYAFTSWPGFDTRAWRAVVDQARERVRPAPAPILGADRDAGAIEAARANAARAGVAGDVAFERRTVSALEPPAGADGPGLLATNPPYGVRVGERGPLRDLFARLGQVARERLPGWTVALLSADRRLEGQLRLPLEEVARTSNGGIPVRVVRARVAERAPAPAGE